VNCVSGSSLQPLIATSADNKKNLQFAIYSLIYCAFSANGDALREKLNELILAAFYASEKKRNKRQYSKRKRAQRSGNDELEDDDSSISSDDICEVHWLYMAGMAFSMSAWVAEKLFFIM